MCFDQHVSFVFVTLMVSLRLCVKKFQFRAKFDLRWAGQDKLCNPPTCEHLMNRPIPQAN